MNTTKDQTTQLVTFGTLLHKRKDHSYIYEASYNGRKVAAKIIVDSSFLSAEVHIANFVSNLLSAERRNFPRLYKCMRNTHENYKNARLLLMEYGSDINYGSIAMFANTAIKPIVAQFLVPLVELHTRGYLHGDVKLANYVSRHEKLFPEPYFYTHCETTYDLTLCSTNLPEPLLIDYELGHLYLHGIPLTDHIVVTISHRPPELFFIQPNGCLYYTSKGEAFSFGVTILEALGLWPSADRYRNDTVFDKLVATIGKLRSMTETFEVAYRFESRITLAHNILRTVSALGCPPDGSPFYQTPLGKVVFDNLYIIVSNPSYNCVWSHPILQHYMGDDGIAMLRSALAWDVDERWSCEELLQHTYFKDLIKVLV